MTRPIGYYVHHHGDGHRQRALAIAAAMHGRMVLLGTGLTGRTGDVPSIDLPDDRIVGGDFDGCDASAARPRSLHYAPIDHDGIRRRSARIAQWIAEARPALFVVDVSVEVAMLARLTSVPTVYVRLSGRRDDEPHAEAFRGASALLAPFHSLLDDDDTPADIRRRTIYAPGLGARPPSIRAEDDVVLAVIGRGGEKIASRQWADAADATPGTRWKVIGPCAVPDACPSNLEFGGWVADAASQVAGAGIVVGAAGDGLVGTVLAARRPFVCLPEDRPYGEQRFKAARLSAVGAAVVAPTWPAPRDWPALLDRARALDPRAQVRLDDPDGAAHVAARLRALADGIDDRERQMA